jgi:hypothetical protein
LIEFIIRSVAANSRDPTELPPRENNTISFVALDIFTNIIGKATRVEIDFPKVALMNLPVRAAA